MLTPQQLKWCLKTISANAFFIMVMDALRSNQALSCIRMADGEKMLMEQVSKQKFNEVLTPPEGYGQDWMKTYGVEGITAGELKMRLTIAATQCSHFAPSITGIHDPKYNVYKLWTEREFFVDNFWMEAWTREQKTDLFKQAGHVLLIHRNASTADSMQLRVQANLGVKVHYIPLNNWRQCPEVIEKAHENKASLVLFSGGPAGKYIGPQIATEGIRPKIVLDVGHGADLFTFSHLPIDRPKAEAFHARWAAANH
ncbi:Uncharacterised protein [uncultured archaeon]|nr:Uncharacterised protein [uncultured archaeon]